MIQTGGLSKTDWWLDLDWWIDPPDQEGMPDLVWNALTAYIEGRICADMAYSHIVL